MISELHTYLNANKPTGVVTVGLGWNLDAIESFEGILPAIYIAHGDEEIEETDHDFVVGYWVTQVAKVAIICEFEDLDTVKNAVRSKIIGWSESANHTQMQSRGGYEQEHKGNLITWIEEYFNEYQGTTA